MVIRLFLSLLALLSGLSVVHAAVPACSAQSAIGASATLVAAVVRKDASAQQVIGLHYLVEHPRSFASEKQAHLTTSLPTLAAAPRTYLGDRTRQ